MKLNLRQLLRPFLLLAALPLFAGESAQHERLNVLFILSDDARPELGCYGAPIQTPNLDKLASESVRFDRAYCQYPLCNPSRTSMLTGLRPTTSGVFSNVSHFRKAHADLVTLPQLFKQHGYTTVGNGKVFHGGLEDAASWTEQLSAKPAMPATGPATVPNPNGGPTTERQGNSSAQMNASDRREILSGEGEQHHDYRVADAAIAAIHRLKDQPFFITCGFLKPHAAPAAPQRFYDLYPPDSITLPADFAALPAAPPGFPAAMMTKANTDLFWNREANAAEAKLMTQAYRASVSWMDWNAGRVLKALDESGLRERTIVVFWGDHGYHLGEMGKWSKHASLFDIGTRVPLMISMPGAKGKGMACSRVIETLDLYPTLAALCGLPVPSHVEGRSLRPLLDEPRSAWEHPAVSVAGAAQPKQPMGRAIRTERWRYIEWEGPEGGAALIDAQNDPHERTNVATKPENAQTVRVLKEQLDKLAPARKTTAAAAPDKAEKPRPNVLFIAVDDLNHWVDHLGRNKQTKTPNIDRLAKMGVSFTSAHCAAPVCNPSRAALLSGRRPSTTGIYDNGQPFERAIKADESVVMQFKNAGYATLGMGKLWHGGLGFPEQWTATGGRQKGGDHGDAKVTDHSIGGIRFGIIDGGDEAVPDTQIADYGIAELGKAHAQPFFLVLGFHKPHMPWNVPQKYYDMHPLDQIELPPVKEGDLSDLPGAGVKMAKPSGDHAAILKSGRWKEAVQAYLAAISYLDGQVGRVLDALEKSPHRDNTIICLWGDHGWHLGEKEHWRKFALWEEATRAPLIWVVPGVTKAGGLCRTPVDFMNIYPTLCDLSNIARPAWVEGQSVRKLLADPTSSSQGVALTTFGQNNHAIRTERWRYIRYADGGEELYDHDTDPYEWTNLASLPEHAELKKQLAAHFPATNAEPQAGPKKGKGKKKGDE